MSDNAYPGHVDMRLTAHLAGKPADAVPVVAVGRGAKLHGPAMRGLQCLNGLQEFIPCADEPFRILKNK